MGSLGRSGGHRSRVLILALIPGRPSWATAAISNSGMKRTTLKTISRSCGSLARRLFQRQRGPIRNPKLLIITIGGFGAAHMPQRAQVASAERGGYTPGCVWRSSVRRRRVPPAALIAQSLSSSGPMQLNDHQCVCASDLTSWCVSYAPALFVATAPPRSTDPDSVPANRQ